VKGDCRMNKAGNFDGSNFSLPRIRIIEAFSDDLTCLSSLVRPSFLARTSGNGSGVALGLESAIPDLQEQRHTCCVTKLKRLGAIRRLQPVQQAIIIVLPD
jgi:hypothetical protein